MLYATRLERATSPRCLRHRFTSRSHEPDVQSTFVSGPLEGVEQARYRPAAAELAFERLRTQQESGSKPDAAGIDSAWRKARSGRGRTGIEQVTAAGARRQEMLEEIVHMPRFGVWGSPKMAICATAVCDLFCKNAGGPFGPAFGALGC